MATPTYYSEGNEPRRTDTRLRVWTKILGRTQDMHATPDPAFDPRRTDTFRTIREKLLKSQRTLL